MIFFSNINKRKYQTDVEAHIIYTYVKFHMQLSVDRYE